MTEIRALGALLIEASDLPAWHALARDVLGCEVAVSDGGLGLRIDAHAQRISVTEGPADDVIALCWEVGSERDLHAVRDRLDLAGIDVSSGDAALCERRGVDALIAFEEPSGLRNEVFVGPAVIVDRPPAFGRPVSGFVTGDQGLGHVILNAQDPAASIAFYRDVLGFRISDHIRLRPAPGVLIDLAFLRCNPRHHSIAIARLPGGKRVQHIMLQYRELDDVGRAYDLSRRAGVPITLGLGRHSNDEMVSFYLKTPSGFDLECGWGALEIEESSWSVKVFDRMSVWGHERISVAPPAPQSKETKPMSLTYESTLKTVKAGDLTLAYNEAGDGPALICIHGGGPGASGWSNYNQNISALSETNRTILIDLPCFGASDKLKLREPRIGFFSKAVVGLLDALDIDQASFVGNSLGGAVSMMTAVRAPERVAKLVLMGPAISYKLTTPLPTEGMKHMAGYYAGAGPSPEKMRALCEIMAFDKGLVTDQLVAERYQASIQPGIMANPLGAPSPESPFEPMWPHASQILHDSLIIWGREDRTIPLDAGFFLASQMKNAELHVYPHCGHWAQLEKALHFNALVSAFLARP